MASLFDSCRLVGKWGEYGDFDLAVADAAARVLAGAVPNPARWRCLRAVRSLSAADAKLLEAAENGPCGPFSGPGALSPWIYK
jgi:hypothetical protein